MPGYLFVISFGLMGTGELGGTYYNNYMVSVSPVRSGARNLSILNLAVAFAGVAPVTYGRIVDAAGFEASFVFAIGLACGALFQLLKLPSRPRDAAC